MPEKIILFTARVPKKLKKDFKIWCEKHDTNMSKEVIRMIMELIYKKSSKKELK